jgi:hypothetical protein
MRFWACLCALMAPGTATVLLDACSAPCIAQKLWSVHSIHIQAWAYGRGFVQRFVRMMDSVVSEDAEAEDLLLLGEVEDRALGEEEVADESRAPLGDGEPIAAAAVPEGVALGSTGAAATEVPGTMEGAAAAGTGQNTSAAAPAGGGPAEQGGGTLGGQLLQATLPAQALRPLPWDGTQWPSPSQRRRHCRQVV